MGEKTPLGFWPGISVTTEGRLLVATLGLVTPHALKSKTEKKHDEKKNHTVKQTRREEHSVIVMFPHISMPLCSHEIMRTFN